LLLYTLTVLPGGTLHAQTFTVIHSFEDGLGGTLPVAGLIEDARGNLYGTTSDNGTLGPGSAYRLTNVQGGWTFSVLTRFGQNDLDGNLPFSGLTLGPDGAFYGTTWLGGNGGPGGDGTVYRLNSATSSSHTVIYRFSGPDGSRPAEAELTFDSAGNIFGTTSFGGSNSEGTVFELICNGNQWTESVIYSFSGLTDGGYPDGKLLFDSAGNLYGTTYTGGIPPLYSGVVYELSPSAGGWTFRVLHSFDGPTGRLPSAGLVKDTAGNLYGTTSAGGLGDGGTVFELSPAGSDWNFSTIYTFENTGGNDGSGPEGPVLLDTAGNLYGTTSSDGAYDQGSVFKLTPTNGGWSFTSLHDFQSPDAEYPYGNLVMDASGNIFGTTYEGGAYDLGTVWEIMP
jgi:uncharacterized repeat protein (TIGR03803 family)